MSNSASKLNFEYAEYSSNGIRDWDPSHQSAISYAIRSDQNRTLAVIAEPWRVQNYPDAKVSSQTVVDTLMGTFFNSQFPIPSEGFIQGFKLANQRIYITDLEKQIPVLCIATAIIDNHLHVASRGSCRVFIARNNMVLQVNAVHTFTEQLIEMGYITPDEAERAIIDSMGPSALGVDEEFTGCDTRMRLEFDKKTNFLVETKTGFPLLINDIILITSGRMFWEFLHREDWQTLENHFKHTDQNLQSLIDNYATQLRSQRGRDINDIAIMALRITEIASTKETMD